MNQTSSREGREKSEKMKKFEEKTNKLNQTMGKLDQLGISSGETVEWWGYLNERGDYMTAPANNKIGNRMSSSFKGGMDIYYNALTRGPLGLY